MVFPIVISINFKAMRSRQTARKLARAIGLQTDLDKILFSVAVVLTVILFILILWFWKKRKGTVHIAGSSDEAKKSDEGRRGRKDPENYPTITIVQKSRSDSKGSVNSEVSSMWDSQSQQYDNTYFKNVQFRKDIEKCLSSSKDEAYYDRSDEISSVPSENQNSYIDRVDQSTFRKKMLHRQLYGVSKSNIEAVDCRDDVYDGARSV